MEKTETRRPFAVWIAMGVVLAFFIAAFWPTFRWMAERFDAGDSFYSHGWLVPIASLWLVWQKRKQLALLPQRASYGGLALLAFFLAVHVIATEWHLGFVSGFAMVGSVWALVWAWCGKVWLRSLRFALFFLLFMVPLPGILLIAVSFKMKLFAASMATWLLNGLGIKAVQLGSTIQLARVSVVVDDACSGLRSLISLLALASLWTALLPAQARIGQKLIVIACAVPIALVANMVRIVILVMLAAIYGPAAAEGFLHFGSGLVVFGVSVMILSWLSGVLTRSAGFGPHDCSA